MLAFSQRTPDIDGKVDEKASLRLLPFIHGSGLMQTVVSTGIYSSGNVKVHTLNGEEKAQIVYISSENWWVGDIRYQKIAN